MQAARWWLGFISPARRRDDPVAIGVGVVGEGDVEAVARARSGRPSRRATSSPSGSCRPSRAGTKRKVGSTRVVDDRQVEAVALGDRGPVGGARAAERVDAEAQAARADRVEVDRPREVVDVGRDVVAAAGPAAPRPARTRARRRSPASSSALASRSIQPVTSVSAGPPCGGLYLKPPSSGGLCEGVTTMPSALPPSAAAVVGEDRVRDDGRRREAVRGVDDDVDAVRGEHLDDGRAAGSESACVSRPRNSGPSMPCCARGSGRPPRSMASDVRLVERRRRSDVPRWPEVPNATRRLRRIPIRGQQRVDVDQVLGPRERAGARVDCHQWIRDPRGRPCRARAG